jgi:hypothetical protein
LRQGRGVLSGFNTCLNVTVVKRAKAPKASSERI